MKKMTTQPPPSGSRRHLEWVVQGDVQGVGFRPFVYRLATELGLNGWVRNSPRGVRIHLEGPADAMVSFEDRLRTESPPPAAVTEYSSREAPREDSDGFEIRASENEGPLRARILPDLATCDACLEEVLDTENRRYGYPFTNCTHCGPRYSIVQKLPYDRPYTTMSRFEMCDRCREEYQDPGDRRFHAQPNACPDCGPRLSWWNREGATLRERERALGACVNALVEGEIVAVKGLGGFHLMVDAGRESSVRRLRALKRRPEKPLALMYPDEATLHWDCRVGAAERELLTSAASPIVLLERSGGDAGLAGSVAPNNPYLGVMLPYTPLHHLLMRRLRRPVVATSANRSGEPICTDERGDFERLQGLADYLLIHDRPIARPVDDSVVQVVHNEPVLIRGGRGYAPLSVSVETDLDYLAVGGELKNTVALASNRQCRLSQHLGDLETVGTDRLHRETTRGLEEIYRVQPQLIGIDPHPDYRSTRYAKARPEPTVAVQHHHAHVVAAMVEHGLEGPLLGVAWDGTGWGPDRTIWGGEFLEATRHDYVRRAHLRRFRLPGGERAVREPRRCALGLLHAIGGEEAAKDSPWFASSGFTSTDREVLVRMLETELNSPVTTSMGRLFDAVSSLLDLQQVAHYEGQAASRVEFLARTAGDDGAYPYDIRTEQGEDGPWVIDWEPMIRGLIRHRRAGEPLPVIAARFHNTLVEMIVDVAGRLGFNRVVLSGGCFQNRYLLERAATRLKKRGFTPFWPRTFPPNDGGLALGQAGVLAAWIKRGGT